MKDKLSWAKKIVELFGTKGTIYILTWWDTEGRAINGNEMADQKVTALKSALLFKTEHRTSALDIASKSALLFKLATAL